MTPKQKVILCLIGNTVVLTLVVTLVAVFAKSGTYWDVGWSDRLVLIGVTIDTPEKYCLLLALITGIQVSKVVVEEIGMPVLGFSIYNPDKKRITEFTKNELQLLANGMFIVSGLRSIFMVMLKISQIDIAVFSLLISELTSVFTIRALLNEKEFDVEKGGDHQELLEDF